MGETINLMAIDTQKFMDAVTFLNTIWTSPLTIVLCMYFLWGILVLLKHSIHLLTYFLYPRVQPLWPVWRRW